MGAKKPGWGPGQTEHNLRSRIAKCMQDHLRDSRALSHLLPSPTGPQRLSAATNRLHV